VVQRGSRGLLRQQSSCLPRKLAPLVPNSHHCIEWGLQMHDCSARRAGLKIPRACLPHSVESPAPLAIGTHVYLGTKMEQACDVFSQRDCGAVMVKVVAPGHQHGPNQNGHVRYTRYFILHRYLSTLHTARTANETIRMFPKTHTSVTGRKRGSCPRVKSK